MKTLIFAMAFIFSGSVLADVTWQDYSDKLLANATKEGKTVVLGFHKRGCSTCRAQDASLFETGITNNKNVTFLKVERKNSDHDKIYEKYGFSKRQWAALVLLKNGNEVSRVNPGVTNESDLKKFALVAR